MLTPPVFVLKNILFGGFTIRQHTLSFENPYLHQREYEYLNIV